jgi:hypothetical protein
MHADGCYAKHDQHAEQYDDAAVASDNADDVGHSQHGVILNTHSIIPGWVRHR